MFYELGRILFQTSASLILTKMLARQEQAARENRNPKPPTIGSRNMPYDLVGDDDMGAIGADVLFGADEDALLHALSVSGDDAELIGGLGNTEIVGAAHAHHPAHHPAHPAAKKAAALRKAALRKIAMRNAGAVVQTGLDRRRRYPLGFVPTVVNAATSALIPSAPQNLFRPERLVIPSDIAFDIGVVDIKVGNQSQLVQSVEVPGALFSEVAIDTNVTFDTAEVGNQVSVQARNKTLAAIEFTAGLIGTIAK
jgi:hypothetical protein